MYAIENIRTVEKIQNHCIKIKFDTMKNQNQHFQNLIDKLHLSRFAINMTNKL